MDLGLFVTSVPLLTVIVTDVRSQRLLSMACAKYVPYGSPFVH